MEPETITEETIPVKEPVKEPVDLAWENAEAKAAFLSENGNPKRKVIPFVLQGENENDFVTGFFYEVDGLTDAKLMAAKLNGAETSFPKAIQALESLILFDESDNRCSQRKYMNGAALVLLSTIEVAIPTGKKK